ncbi:hypothetical protein C8R44DRAFT_875249 [Mycena epipterygia]|nr:hypothetical protein C8R44DRAFT_875249 [Mycena epipterygia]
MLRSGLITLVPQPSRARWIGILRTRFNFWIIEFGNLTRCTLNWLHGLIQVRITHNLNRDRVNQSRTTFVSLT